MSVRLSTHAEVLSNCTQHFAILASTVWAIAYNVVGVNRFPCFPTDCGGSPTASRVELDSKSPSAAAWLLPELADIAFWWQHNYLYVAGKLQLDLLAPFEGLLTDLPGKLPLQFSQMRLYSPPVAAPFDVEVEAA